MTLTNSAAASVLCSVRARRAHFAHIFIIASTTFATIIGPAESHLPKLRKLPNKLAKTTSRINQDKIKAG